MRLKRKACVDQTDVMSLFSFRLDPAGVHWIRPGLRKCKCDSLIDLDQDISEPQALL